MSTLTKNHSRQLCECCQKVKMCKMYVLQMGTAAWVCDGCREDKR